MDENLSCCSLGWITKQKTTKNCPLNNNNIIYSVYIINLNDAFSWDKKGDKRPHR